MVTGNASPTSQSVELRPILEDSFTKVLSSIGCENVYFEELPPVTSPQELFNYLRVNQGEGQGILEGWFFRRLSIRHDATQTAHNRYAQIHAMSITGVAHHNDFHRSYQYIQDKTEQLMWTLEKNKNFISSSIDTVNVNNARFSFEQFGELYLYRSETTFDVHRSVTEAGGRSFV